MNESGASETSKGMVLVNAAVVHSEWHSYPCKDITEGYSFVAPTVSFYGEGSK